MTRDIYGPVIRGRAGRAPLPARSARSADPTLMHSGQGLCRDVIHHQRLLQHVAQHRDKLLMRRLVEILLLQRFL